MNTENFSKILLEIHRLARSSPMQDFQRLALDAMSARFDFDSAWWGIAVRQPHGALEIHTSQPYRLPAFYPTLWGEIKDDDVLANAVLVTPGSTINMGRKQLYSAPGLASLMARFGITSCLSTVTLLPEINLMVFLSLYRVDGKPAFNDRERRYTELLMPHLTEALTANWMLHLERIRAHHGPDHTALAVVDRRGILHVADQTITERLHSEWPQWTGPMMPAPLLAHLRSGTEFCGEHLTVRFHPVGDLWLVDLRSQSSTVRLSPREAEIAQQFSAGASYKEIARVLGIAPNTARHHLREIYRKLDVSDKGALAQKLALIGHADVDIEGLGRFEELPGAHTGFAQLPI